MYWGRGLELAPNLDLLKGLDDVAHLYVIIVLDIDTALETRDHFLGFVLEALERLQLTRMDDHTVADDAHLVGTLDLAIGDHTAGDGADLAHLEGLQYLQIGCDLLANVWREHALEGVADIFDSIVDDRVGADLDASCSASLRA